MFIGQNRCQKIPNKARFFVVSPLGITHQLRNSNVINSGITIAMAMIDEYMSREMIQPVIIF